MNQLVFGLLAFLLFTCCTATDKATVANNARFSYEATASGVNEKGKEVVARGQEQQNNPQRVVIYDASLWLQVKQPDSTNVYLSELANRYQGYALSLGNQRSVIRVRAAYLNQAIEDIGKQGKLNQKTVQGQDVTAEFHDFEIRLENARKARNRYLELLARAENVEAALKVEKELERLNGEIDVLEGNLNRLQHLAEYSTITVHLQEKKKLGLLGYIGVGVYKGIKWLFVRN